MKSRVVYYLSVTLSNLPDHSVSFGLGLTLHILSTVGLRSVLKVWLSLYILNVCFRLTLKIVWCLTLNVCLGRTIDIGLRRIIDIGLRRIIDIGLRCTIDISLLNFSHSFVSFLNLVHVVFFIFVWKKNLLSWEILFFWWHESQIEVKILLILIFAFFHRLFDLWDVPSLLSYFWICLSIHIN